PAPGPGAPRSRRPRSPGREHRVAASPTTRYPRLRAARAAPGRAGCHLREPRDPRGHQRLAQAIGDATPRILVTGDLPHRPHAHHRVAEKQLIDLMQVMITESRLAARQAERRERLE